MPRVISFRAAADDLENSIWTEEAEDPDISVMGFDPESDTRSTEPGNLDASVAGKSVALVGRFGSMNQREAGKVLQSYGATVVDLPRRRESEKSAPIDWVVIGAEQPTLTQGELLPAWIVESAAAGETEVIDESELWKRVGLVDVELSARQLYTPSMLAELLGVSVRIIRRWHRRDLITPVCCIHKLPYFDFTEVTTARRLAGWIAAGASPEAIERRLVEWVQVLPGIRRPLDQLSILIEGKQVLLRQGNGLVEPGGQMRFDFDAAEDTAVPNAPPDQPTLDDIVAFVQPDQPPMLRSIAMVPEDSLLEAAYCAEDDDDLETAVDLYHTILARDGARADISFQIGELLYRMNFLVAARERYYSAIELDPEFVEARASLGAVLAELGQHDLAIAALRGALKLYPDYLDVHYTLARTLDQNGDVDRSLDHWQRIIELAPTSPWADEARGRLGIDSD